MLSTGHTFILAFAHFSMDSVFRGGAKVSQAGIDTYILLVVVAFTSLAVIVSLLLLTMFVCLSSHQRQRDHRSMIPLATPDIAGRPDPSESKKFKLPNPHGVAFVTKHCVSGRN